MCVIKHSHPINHTTRVYCVLIMHTTKAHIKHDQTQKLNNCNKDYLEKCGYKYDGKQWVKK